MDTKKLSKIVKAIVSAEVKRQLPALVKEEVDRKMKRVLTEVKKMNAKPEPKKTVQEDDMFSLANEILAESRGGEVPVPQASMLDEEDETHFSKNPMIDKILRETKPFSAAQRTAGPVGFEQNPRVQQLNEVSGDDTGYEEWPTMQHNMSANPGQGSPVPEDIKAQMAAKMGYGDMNRGPQRNGLGVTTGLPALDRVLNRDNSALIKAWDKKR